MARHHLMTSVKNEAVYLVEWVAHHKTLGFDQIYLAANNCNDGTVALAQKLHNHGFIKFRHNKCAPDKIPQHEGYKALRKRFDVDACDWLMVLDVDEFLHVETGDGTVGALTAQAADTVDIISLNAMTFGTGPAPTADSYDLTTRQFKHRLPADHKVNRALKSLTRAPARFRGTHNHNMVNIDPPTSLVVMRGDGSTFDIPAGTPLWEVLRNSATSDITQRLAHYNHYAIKSSAEYLMRQKRGRGAVSPLTTGKLRHSVDYFEKRAAASIADDRIEKYAEGTLNWMETMLAEPAIREADAHAKTRFFTRIGRLNAST